ncbi:hypothetical protein PF005_g17125 [Phytophthora fragariae]|uniref:Secreted protein n=1 Tax=Phytophthora fragariae TaxID=53985 RepID=A0A6A3T8J9_9STRA|nr:hypothetical protein PF003_g30106 [Phytophthora fragariae]KAE8932388.1 hypothetical protein PF009_g17581 [Phytophthora fragariae]KAE8998245.1 hypothetical protein PF011_g15136 [Phytophthora fragariae]KAE9096764.1 hypothetical protein PF010_g16218 [Phytophthora fragariae]KAE9100408.1 hypothetical protein PF007_g15523 [Phytophthora fragariae]
MASIRHSPRSACRLFLLLTSNCRASPVQCICSPSLDHRVVTPLLCRNAALIFLISSPFSATCRCAVCQ